MDVLQRKITGTYLTSTLVPPFYASKGFPGVRIFRREPTIYRLGQCARVLCLLLNREDTSPPGSC